MCISSDNRVVVVHPGFRSNRKDPVHLGGEVAVVGGNVGGDLHAMDAGAGRDRGAGAYCSSGHIVGIEYVRGAVGCVRSRAGKINRVGRRAQPVPAVQYTIDFGEVSWRSACERIRFSYGAALQNTGAGSSGSRLELYIDPVNRSAAVQVAFIDNLSRVVRDHSTSDCSIRGATCRD